MYSIFRQITVIYQIMKIQIISKLNKNQSNLNPHPNSDLAQPSQPYKQTPRILNFDNDYYYNVQASKPFSNRQTNNKESILYFFNQIQSNSIVKYEKVQLKYIGLPYKRKLLFFVNDKTKNGIDDYQFSFKKKENNKINAQNKQKINTQQNTINTKNLNTIKMHPNSPKYVSYQQNHFFNSKTNRIRKFNSLATISSNSSKHSHVVNQHSNHNAISSVVKKQNSLNKMIRFYGKRIDNNKTQASQVQCQIDDYNAEDMKVQNKKNGVFDYVKQKLRTQLNFEEQKQRLSRIRKQLNDIYQMKKIAPQFKLKLY